MCQGRSIHMIKLYTHKKFRQLRVRRLVAAVMMLAMLLPSLAVFPQTAYAANVAIRQEINLIDGYFTATSGNYATTSAIIQIDTAKYNGASYYFEAVASTTVAASRLLLRNATTFATVTSVDVSGTSATRYRSGSAFTPTSGANDYVAVWENQSVGKSAAAIRVVILQNAASITDTETQIEMGSTASSSNTTTAALPNPMYFYYDENKWDGNITASAEVTYQLGPQLASSTTYTVPGTYRNALTSGVSYLTIEPWGAGGGGSLQTNTGGGGGGGGAYAASTFATTSGQGTIVVGVGGTSDNAAAATDSSYNSNTDILYGVIADAGLGASSGTGVLGGNLTNTVGQIEFVGGNGGNSEGGDDSGGGGGGAGGPAGQGNNGTTPLAADNAGGPGGSGNAGSGGAGGVRGNNATCTSGGDGGP